MGDFESSAQVTAGEQVLFEYLSDVSNLPKYFAMMKRAERTGPEEVETAADVNGVTREGRASFKVDYDRKQIQWASEGDSGYSGVLDVTGDTRQATVTVRLHTERVDDGDEQVAQGLDETLAQIKRLVEVDSS
jgi:carbon monoxide dehydrogenase subunit G